MGKQAKADFPLFPEPMRLVNCVTRVTALEQKLATLVNGMAPGTGSDLILLDTPPHAQPLALQAAKASDLILTRRAREESRLVIFKRKIKNLATIYFAQPPL